MNISRKPQLLRVGDAKRLTRGTIGPVNELSGIGRQPAG